eukprot:m.118805 g.118805  ORF g.118805 m.118805 type:complete len:60 (+) comp28698_c2_seq1:2621-2800(+)
MSIPECAKPTSRRQQWCEECDNKVVVTSTNKPIESFLIRIEFDLDSTENLAKDPEAWHQ